MKNLLTSVLAIMGGAVLAGCSLLQGAMPGATLSDGNVLAMLDTINMSEIEAAQLAEVKASSEMVRTFSSRMLTEHTTMRQDTRQLAQRIRVRPEAPALASTVEMTHQKTIADMKRSRAATSIEPT